MSTPSELPEDPTQSLIPSRRITLSQVNPVTAETIERAESPIESLRAVSESESGPLALLNIIGRGGMGEVWAAEQRSLRRIVAVKRAILRTDKSIDELALSEEQFRFEAMVAASLEHPGIVPVHDLCEDPDGAPLIVMKRVQGTPWDRQIAEDMQRLSPPEFLAAHLPILIAMAQAVAFAHSRGIVHRDLKPSQVMVGEFGETLLMDWGLALCIDQGDQPIGAKPTAQPNLPTPASASNPAGTPALMAPEQTEDDARHIGPWTDVYLLGATLYFLLCGTYPHSAPTSARSMAMAKEGKVIPPSQRAKDRAVPPDLESLCLRALEPTPSLRLPNAISFVTGLKDHLSGASRRRESEETCAEAASLLAAPSPSYEVYNSALAKITRASTLWELNPEIASLELRARGSYARAALANGDLILARLQAESLTDKAEQVGMLSAIDQAADRLRATARQRRSAIAAAFALLFVVLVGGGVFTAGLSRSLKQTRIAKQKAEAAEKEAEANLAIARVQGDGAYEVVHFILRDLKYSLDNELTTERGITVPVAEEVSSAIAGNVASPVVNYFTGIDATKWPKDLKLKHAERMADASQQFHVLARYLESEHLTTYTLALRERELPPDDPAIADSLNQLGLLYNSMGRFTDSIPLLERALKIIEVQYGPESHETANALNNLGMALSSSGEQGRAQPILRRAANIWQDNTGPDEAYYALALSNLAATMDGKSEIEEATVLNRHALEIRERLAGYDSLDVAESLNNLASVRQKAGDLDESRQLLLRALAVYQKNYGPEDSRTAQVINNIGYGYYLAGEMPAALDYYSRALAITEKTLGPDHPYTARMLFNVADVKATLGDVAAAIPMHRRALAIREKTYGPESEDAINSLFALAPLLQSTGEVTEARDIYVRVLKVIDKVFGSKHVETGRVLCELGALEILVGDLPAARQHLERSLPILTNNLPAESPELQQHRQQMKLLEEREKAGEM